MKTVYLTMIAIMGISVTLMPFQALAQSPDVACGWHIWFDKYEFNENDTIPIKIRDPCYPQEGTTVTVTVSDGTTTNVTGKYLNQTIITANSTFIINFKKPVDSNQYRFLVALEYPRNSYQDNGVGAFVFTKPNASQIAITDFSISPTKDSTGNQWIHAKLIDGIGNPLNGAKWGLSVHAELLIPKCDFGIYCLDPNLDLTPNTLNQSFSAPFNIPTDLSNGVYNMTISAGSYDQGYQPTSIVVPVSINNGTMKELMTSDTSVDNLTTQKPQCCGPACVPLVPDSPLEQFKSGTPALDVKCNDGLQLILKAEDASPACVKPDTAQILIERGWAWNYANVVGKESISLSAYQGVSDETFYNNGTVASNFTINVNINNFKPSNASLVLQVYYNDGILYKTISVPSGMIQPDGFYKYPLIAISDENHPVPFKVVATYNNETTMAYAPVFAHP